MSKFTNTYIYLSYRHMDDEPENGQAITKIYRSLRHEYANDEIFFDKNILDHGLRDVTEEVNLSINVCDIILVIIGKGWLSQLARLGDTTVFDPVRLEIATGLRRSDVVVVPVLLDDATIPSGDGLPDSISGLASKWAAKIRTTDENVFESDMDKLKIRLRTRHSHTGGISAVGDFSVDFICNALLRDGLPDDATQPTQKSLTKRKKEVRIAQIWFSLMPHMMNILLTVVKRKDWDTKIKIVLLKPDCEAGRTRSLDLGKDANYCEKEVLHSLWVIISSFKGLEQRRCIEVRFYDGLLAFPIYWIDDTAVIGFYQHAKLSYETPHLYIRNVQSDMGRVVQDEFNNLWENLTNHELDLEASTPDKPVLVKREKRT